MVGTVYDRSFDVHDREAGEYTIFHGFFDTIQCRLNIFSRYGAADDSAVELAASTWLQRFEFNPYVTVLTTTTGLTYEFTFDASLCTEGFTVSNLRFTHVGFYLELATHAVDDDVEVKLTHTSQNRLTGFFIRMSTQRRIFFRQFAQSNAHFVLVGFGLRFNGNLDNLGSGKFIDSRITGAFSSQSVSPVPVSFKPTAAAISPA